MKKKTFVLGATTNPERYAFKAVKNLLANGHEVIAYGIKEGQIDGHQITTKLDQYRDIDTVTLYIGPARQPEYYDYILSLSPKRVIFNPGTENDEFIELCKSKNIEAEVACTLVLLSIGQY